MKKLLLGFMLIFFALFNAQKMKVVSGDLGFLKEEKEIKVVFTFPETTFYKEKMDENSYIQKRMKEISSEKGQEEADRWRTDWEQTKKVSIPHKFLSSLNKYGNIKGSEDSPAKYTLIVETVWIYPGWFAGVMNQPSKISTLLKFVESSNPKNILAVVESNNAPGDNFVGLPNNNDRIAEGYAKTSKSLAKIINKK